MTRLTKHATVAFVVGASGILIDLAAGEDIGVSSQRITPIVRVIQRIEPAVVALFTATDGGIGSGSGTIIHPDGFVLTNNHVLPKPNGHALLSDGRPLQFRVVGRLPERDIAVVQLMGAQTPLPVIPLGRSRDILNGETVVVAGNPGGRGTIYTSGIVSSRSVLEGGPNALVMTNYKTDYRDRFIQFDAASNPGNSGGPLVNMDGELIGIVSGLILQEQNAGLAIPVDRVWDRFRDVMEAEMLLGKSTGIAVNPTADRATVSRVEDGSAAAFAGVQLGDVIAAVNGRTVRHSIDWELSLLFETKPDKTLTLAIHRADKPLELELQLQRDEGLAAVAIENPEPGLTYRLYHGEFSLLPDFATLTTVREDVVPMVDLAAMRQNRADAFALLVTGYLKVPVDGIYRLIVRSDDGSRVLLNDQLVIDNDGNHPSKQASKRLRLKAGLHPLRIEHFEGNGEEALQFAIEMPDGVGREVSPDMLFH
ncbi:MAG: trypsin-like peptidase domain-containing protein [Planctomycetaceae bacterium]|nr:trypsin-like peptidase domain-containing protein [Planctomycetales bacterium]MCB9925001.1 trypsin-like peptidase domain-containing protein [Planctomycetaceae bacterium]